MTKTYKVDLVARFVGFQEITVEADSELAARQAAYEEGQKLAALGLTSPWDIQYVDYHNSAKRNRDGTVQCIYEVEVNEVNEVEID